MTIVHRFSDAARNLTGSPMFKVLARAQELERAGERVVHFEIGDPDFATPTHITDAAVTALRAGDTHYANSLGIRELREAVADYVAPDLGARPRVGQIAVAPAISFIYFIARCLVNPGDEIVVSDPGYSSYFSAFDFVGARTVLVPTLEKNGFRLKAADVERVITPRTRILFINSPQNPTGSMMEKNDLENIFTLAQRHDFYVLTDEVYAKMTYDMPHYSIAVSDQCNERVILLSGFSKAYAMSGWRLGYAVAPEPVVEKLGLMIQTIISNVPPFVQRGGIAALTGSQQCVTDMMREYRARRDLMVAGLRGLLGVTCIEPDGAFYTFPNITGTGMTSEQFCERMLEEARVVLLPGTNFGPSGEGYVRLCFSVSRSEIEEGLRRMHRILS
ncbi:MAG: class I and II aminotransferase [Parcubacteria group bacterium Gr01-1014_70]|nr:MAG: class I and II aminotransferase [Parcubacteria group bacterium Gr01-1014_70]